MIRDRSVETGMMLEPAVCHKARLSRDARFDGQFFTAVKTTGIYCRSICPATPPKEKNVEYYPSAVEAANAGYRPCLRCRPDSAPGSPAWKGVNTTLERAVRLINEGALQQGSLIALSARLGIGDRYLRRLFQKHMGISPKDYALYQQCLFAKQLLHDSRLAITQVALASGFNSIRRFNDCFKSRIGLTPSQVRKSGKPDSSQLLLKLYYRPPYDWSNMHRFLSARMIPGLEWSNGNSYGRTISWNYCHGQFTARHIPNENRFDVEIELDDIRALKPVIGNIRRVLDLDTDIASIERTLNRHFSSSIKITPGLRLPGTWSMFEAGIRAILGQQVSVAAARGLVTQLVDELGEPRDASGKYFPTAQSIANDALDFLKLPGSRKQALRNLAQHYIDSDNPNDSGRWLALKGVGPWTVDYARMRGLSEPDICLLGDLGVQRAIATSNAAFNPDCASPWRSYLTIQLWNQP